VIFNNFQLWSRISLERLQISKIKKQCDRQQFLPHSTKKSDELWPTNKKFYWITWSHPYISLPGECCPLKFLHALEINRGLLAHSELGWGAPKNFWWWKFKIWPKFQSISPHNFGASGSILTKLFPYDVPQGSVITWVKLLEGRPPKIWDGEKTHKIERTFFYNFRLWSRISPEQLQISKIGQQRDRQQFLPRSTKKVWWTLVNKQKVLLANIDHPSGFFGGRRHFGP